MQAPLPLHFGLECIAAAMRNTLGGLLGDAHFPLRFEFPYAAPRTGSATARSWATTCILSSPRGQLELSTEHLARHHCRARTRPCASSTRPSARACSRTSRNPRTSPPRPAACCASSRASTRKCRSSPPCCNVSPRTYRRRLAEQGTSFQAASRRGARRTRHAPPARGAPAHRQHRLPAGLQRSLQLPPRLPALDRPLRPPPPCARPRGHPRRERPPLDVWLGAGAARHIAEHGWRGGDIALLLGASGGPKWLILGHLDRLLFGDFLLGTARCAPASASAPPWAPGATPAWPRTIPPRPSSASRTSTSTGPTAKNPDATRSARQRRHARTHPRRSGRGADRGASPAAQLHRHGPRPRLNSARTGHRHCGPAWAPRPWPMPIDRSPAAGSQFQRVVFRSRGAPACPCDFATRQVTLEADTVAPALHASGSIPFVLAGERDIAGAPRGPLLGRRHHRLSLRPAAALATSR
jgi:hypothetical protein